MPTESEPFEVPGDVVDVGISDLLPVCIATCELDGDAAPEVLYPDEEALISNAVAKRRREFARGRMCAHYAMSYLGLSPCPVLTSADRTPLWPPGLVGSITHCEAYAAAAVATRETMLSVGIDAEMNRPLPEGVLAIIASPSERNHLAHLPQCSVHWDVALFSAKESIFKACFPVTKEWMDFCDVKVELDLKGNNFFAVPLRGPWSGRRISGHFGLKGCIVLTAVALSVGD